jgi:hypothetical protein
MIFEDFFGKVTLVDDPIINLIIVAIVGKISHITSYRFVGSMYKLGAIDGKTTGSFWYWVVKGIIVGFQILLMRMGGLIYNWLDKFIH